MDQEDINDLIAKNPSPEARLNTADKYGSYCTWGNIVAKADKDIWSTTCNEDHIFIAGTPKENSFRWCPYCGLPIIYG